MLKYQVSKRIEEAYASMNEGPSPAKEPVDYISDDVGAYDNVCDAVGRVVKSVSSHMVETDLDDAWTDARGPLEGAPFNVVVYATSSDIRRANLGTAPVCLSNGNWALVTEIPFADSKPRLDAYAMMLSKALSDAGTGLSAEIDDRNSQIDDVVEDDEGNGYRGMMDVVLRFKVADEAKWMEFVRSHEGGNHITKAYGTVNESYDDMETADYGREEYAADDKDISKGDTYSDIIGTISELKSEDKDVFIYQVIKEIARRISKGESDGADERSLVVRDGCSSLPEVEGVIEDGIERLRGLEKVSESDTDYENEFTAMSDDELERAHLNAIRTRSVDLEAIRDEIARREAEADKKAEF